MGKTQARTQTMSSEGKQPQEAVRRRKAEEEGSPECGPKTRAAVAGRTQARGGLARRTGLVLVLLLLLLLPVIAHAKLVHHQARWKPPPSPSPPSPWP